MTDSEVPQGNQDGALARSDKAKQPKASKSMPADLASIHKGSVFFENSQYGAVQVVALTEPVLNGVEWTFKGLAGDTEVDFLINLDYRHYGPRFGKEPTYFPVEYLTDVSDLVKENKEASND
jgi:hypothetical protein